MQGWLVGWMGAPLPENSEPQRKEFMTVKEVISALEQMPEHATVGSYNPVLAEFMVITGFDFVKDEFPNETIKEDSEAAGYVQFFIETK
jgi:hypothetical protein